MKHKRLAFLFAILLLALVILVVVSSPTGTPSTIRYYFVHEGMTRTQVEAQLGPGMETTDLQNERENLQECGITVVDANLILCWGFRSWGLISNKPAIIRIGFKDGKVCYKQLKTIGS